MPKKDTLIFLEKICNNATKKEFHISYNLREISNYLESLSSTSRNNIISDSFWNRYPKNVQWKKYFPNNVKAHARGISYLIKFIYSNKDKYPKTYNSFLKNSSGIFLYYAINYFHGNERMKLAKRGVSSKDLRVKKISARILPIKFIENLANDSDYGVSSIIANRISPSAKPNLFLHSKNNRARFESILALEPDRDTIFQMINERLANSKDWRIAREIICLLDKLNDNDILFFINISGNVKIITDYFKNRLS